MEEYTQITLDQWTQWKEDIRNKLAETAGNFVYIGYRLKQIRDSGMFGGAADVFEFAKNEYGLGKSTVSRFIAINEKYSEGGNSLELREEFKRFSSSKLAEMLTLPDSEIQLITEKTTVKEIRELKEFDRQTPPAEEVTEVTWTPLEKCLVDFFKVRKEMLNGIMACMGENPPEYKKAAELMNPSGQNSHKKGIMFLFLYDWSMGVKYKLMTEPEPVSLTWPELLNTIFGIYAHCDLTDVWSDFYAEPEEEKREEKAEEEKAPQPQSNQGESAPVATSQQTEKEPAAAVMETTPEDVTEVAESVSETAENVTKEAENVPEEAEIVPKTEETVPEAPHRQGESDENEETTKEGIEKRSVESNEEPVAETGHIIPPSGAGSEESTPGDLRGVDERGSAEIGTHDTAERVGGEIRETDKVAGKYDQTITQLINDVAYKSRRIADILQDRERKELNEYRLIKASVNVLSLDLEQLMRFVDLQEEDEMEGEEHGE